jgi:hypothetical protein
MSNIDRLNEIIHELDKGLPINSNGIEKLKKLIHEVNLISQKEDDLSFKKNIQQTINKQLSTLLHYEEKSIKRIPLFKDTVLNFKQDIQEYLRKSNS